jgi:hypothetical protein
MHMQAIPAAFSPPLCCTSVNGLPTTGVCLPAYCVDSASPWSAHSILNSLSTSGYASGRVARWVEGWGGAPSLGRGAVVVASPGLGGIRLKVASMASRDCRGERQGSSGAA